MTATTRSGWAAASSCARTRACSRTCRRAAPPVERGVQLQALAAGRHRERLQTVLAQPVGDEERDPRRTPRSPAGGPGSRSTTSRSGWRRPPRGPTVHCGVCSSSAPWLAAQTSDATSSSTGRSSIVPSSSVPGEAGSTWCRTHDGAPRGRFFSKNFSPGDALRPPDPGDRAVAQLAQDRRRHLQVVVQHLGLGRPGRRVHDPVEVADPQRPRRPRRPRIRSSVRVGALARCTSTGSQVLPGVDARRRRAPRARPAGAGARSVMRVR